MIQIPTAKPFTFCQECIRQIPKNIRTHSSLDLNTLNNYIWGFINRETNQRSCNAKESLRDAIVDINENLRVVSDAALRPSPRLRVVL